MPGNTSADLGSWLDRQPPAWCSGVRVVATDLAESYRAALGDRLQQAIRVADPFHVVRVANRGLDQVRRRVQNATLGHRGRRRDPLYRIRTLMLTGAERLDGTGVERMLLGARAGDPDDEVLGAWLAKESVRDVYLTEDAADAELLLDKAIEGCRLDLVPEVRGVGRTLARWRDVVELGGRRVRRRRPRRQRRPHLPQHRGDDGRATDAAAERGEPRGCGRGGGRRGEVELALDREPREVEVPADLAEALAGDEAARRTFEGLSYGERRRLVLAIEGAKKAETRGRRVAKTVELLREGRAR